MLAALLAMVFVLQLFLARADEDLPPVLAVSAARSNFIAPSVAPVAVPSGIFQRPLFAPRQSLAATGAVAAPPPLGGAVVAGTATIRRRTFAVVRRSDGSVANVAIGGVVSGWRLVALGQERAVFVKGGERLQIPYGAQPTSTGGEGEAPTE
ncbi:MAG: hypothetical protein ACKVOP_01015 [Sphingomonadaceae bacterium]